MRSFDLIAFVALASLLLFLLGPAPLPDPTGAESGGPLPPGPQPRLLVLRTSDGFLAQLDPPSEWQAPPQRLEIRGADGSVLATSEESPLELRLASTWSSLEGLVIAADGEIATLRIER